MSQSDEGDDHDDAASAMEANFATWLGSGETEAMDMMRCRERDPGHPSVA